MLAFRSTAFSGSALYRQLKHCSRSFWLLSSAVTHEFQHSLPRNWPTKGNVFMASLVEFICCNPCRICWRKFLRGPRCLLVSRRAEHDEASPQFTALFIQNCTLVSETPAIFSNLLIWQAEGCRLDDVCKDKLPLCFAAAHYHDVLLVQAFC